MNEAEFSRSIGKLINNRLTKDKAQGEDVAKLFDHPNRNQSEIDRAVRLAVFGRLAGLQDQLSRILQQNQSAVIRSIIHSPQKVTPSHEH